MEMNYEIQDGLNGYDEFYKTFCVLSIPQIAFHDNLGKPYENRYLILVGMTKIIKKTEEKDAENPHKQKVFRKVSWFWAIKIRLCVE